MDRTGKIGGVLVLACIMVFYFSCNDKLRDASHKPKANLQKVSDKKRPGIGKKPETVVIQPTDEKKPDAVKKPDTTVTHPSGEKKSDAAKKPVRSEKQPPVTQQPDVANKPVTPVEQSPVKRKQDAANKPATPLKQRSSEKEPVIAKQPKIKNKQIAPFSRHEDRYQALFKSLIKNEMKPERIVAIFSSKKATIKDKTPVERMSKKVIASPAMRTNKQIKRIAKKIAKHLKKYKKEYDKLEKNADVNREIAAAILFKETHLGEFNNWKHESFTVLNNILSFMPASGKLDDCNNRRQKRIIETAQKSLQGLLLYCHRHQLDIIKKNFPSSFAGAVGIPQFMPMYMDYAISENNTIPDLSKMADAIQSIGNIFNKKFYWLGFMDIDKLEKIDAIRNNYIDYDKTRKSSFCMSEDLDGYKLQRFADDHADIPDIEYICAYAETLMNYNYSSVYVLDVFQFAFHVHKMRPPTKTDAIKIHPISFTTNP